MAVGGPTQLGHENPSLSWLPRLFDYQSLVSKGPLFYYNSGMLGHARGGCDLRQLQDDYFDYQPRQWHPHFPTWSRCEGGLIINHLIINNSLRLLITRLLVLPILYFDIGKVLIEFLHLREDSLLSYRLSMSSADTHATVGERKVGGT